MTPLELIATACSRAGHVLLARDLPGLAALQVVYAALCAYGWLRGRANP